MRRREFLSGFLADEQFGPAKAVDSGFIVERHYNDPLFP
jgi:hypothetical protein